MRNDPMGSVEDTIDEAVAAARTASASTSDVAENFQTAIDRSVADQPLTTLAMAAAVGFILGAIWKA